MKTLYSTLLVLGTATTLSLLTATASPQDQNPPPALPVPPVPPVEPHPAPPVPDIKPILEDVRRQVDVAREQVAQALGGAADVFPPFTGPDANLLFRPGARPARSLVIATAEMDAETLATADEDLNIMARILDKALPGREDDRSDRRAMGIAISTVSGGGGSARNLYLEGYGALFFLDVRFPLLSPEKQKKETRAKDDKSSAWEEARSELYSTRGPRRNTVIHWKESGRGENEEYDEDKVQRLKDSLLDALKHATHIRAVKPDDQVTVVISGGAAGAQDRLFVREVTGPDGERTERDRPAYAVNATGHLRLKSSQSTSTMTIRAKKSDIDAFAQGKLDLDQFKKKATIHIY
jgi:hypothetical protein